MRGGAIPYMLIIPAGGGIGGHQETAEGAEKSVLKVLEECLAGLRGNVTAEGQGSLDALEGLPKRLEMASGTQDALQRLSQTAADEANTALVKVSATQHRPPPPAKTLDGFAAETVLCCVSVSPTVEKDDVL